MARKVTAAEAAERKEWGRRLNEERDYQGVSIEDVRVAIGAKSLTTVHDIHNGGSWTPGNIRKYLELLGKDRTLFGDGPQEQPREAADDAADAWWKAQPWDVKSQLWLMGRWLVDNFDEPGRFAEMNALADYMRERHPNG